MRFVCVYAFITKEGIAKGILRANKSNSSTKLEAVNTLLSGNGFFSVKQVPKRHGKWNGRQIRLTRNISFVDIMVRRYNDS